MTPKQAVLSLEAWLKLRPDSYPVSILIEDRGDSGGVSVEWDCNKLFIKFLGSSAVPSSRYFLEDATEQRIAEVFSSLDKFLADMSGAKKHREFIQKQFVEDVTQALTKYGIPIPK
jgi:hypothetical protein